MRIARHSSACNERSEKNTYGGTRTRDRETRLGCVFLTVPVTILVIVIVVLFRQIDRVDYVRPAVRVRPRIVLRRRPREELRKPRPDRRVCVRLRKRRRFGTPGSGTPHRLLGRRQPLL